MKRDGAGTVGGNRGAAIDPVRSGRRDLQSVLEQLGAVHFEQLDVDDHFGPRLVDGSQEPRGRCDALRRILNRDRIGRRGRRDAARVEDQPHQVHRFLQVGVAQVKRPHDLFLVFTALGRRIRYHGDRARRRDAKEAARRAGHGVERVLERRVAEVDGQRLIAKRRVEDQADVREPRDGRENFAAVGIAEDQGRRHLHAGREVEARRRQVARAFDERLQLGLALARDGDSRAQLAARRSQLVVDFAVRRVQFGGDFVFGERLIEPGERHEPATLGEMRLRGAQLRAVEGEACVRVVRPEPDRFGVLDHRDVVVLPALRITGPTHRARRGAARGQKADGEERGAKSPRRRRRASVRMR